MHSIHLFIFQEGEIEEKNFNFKQMLLIAPFSESTSDVPKRGKKLKQDQNMTIFDYFDDEILSQASKV